MSLQIKEILEIAEKRLSDAGVSDSKIDAKILLGFQLRYDDHKMFMNWSRDLEQRNCEEYFELIDRRASGEPTQYITGVQEFMGIRFKVDTRVLIPRQDTEILVEDVLKYAKARKSKLKVLDLCTGSGAIAISLAKKNSDLKLTAVDVSKDALDVAKKNATSAGVSGNIEFIQSDMFKNLKSKKFDIIISNPPYIKTSVLPTLQREIYEHEPMLALDGGDDGLDFYRQIIDESPQYLRQNGALFLEIGYDQGSDISIALEMSGKYKNVQIKKDLLEFDRVVTAEALSKKDYKEMEKAEKRRQKDEEKARKEAEKNRKIEEAAAEKKAKKEAKENKKNKKKEK